ncbi:hypothetical protein [Deinococcus sonorensis]|uniref:DUF4154 domain-containing protein n=1 Tax=Deinococcus sonorensis TaxID=309891 RepID=A0ABV8YBB9_9DEIO
MRRPDSGESIARRRARRPLVFLAILGASTLLPVRAQTPAATTQVTPCAAQQANLAAGRTLGRDAVLQALGSAQGEVLLVGGAQLDAPLLAALRGAQQRGVRLRGLLDPAAPAGLSVLMLQALHLPRGTGVTVMTTQDRLVILRGGREEVYRGAAVTAVQGNLRQALTVPPRPAPGRP